MGTVDRVSVDFATAPVTALHRRLDLFPGPAAALAEAVFAEPSFSVGRNGTGSDFLFLASLFPVRDSSELSANSCEFISIVTVSHILIRSGLHRHAEAWLLHLVGRSG